MRISLKEIYMEQHFDKQPSLRNIFYLKIELFTNIKFSLCLSLLL